MTFRQFQNENSIDACTWNDKQLTVNKRLLQMKSSQKSCEMSVSAKYPVSKARTQNPLETRIQSLHHASLHFFVWWNAIQHHIWHHSQKCKKLVY